MYTIVDTHIIIIYNDLEPNNKLYYNSVLEIVDNTIYNKYNINIINI